MKKSKVIIITGAASGLGRAIAQEFDKSNCKLVLCDINKINPEEYNNEVLALKIDLLNEKDIEKLYSQSIKKFKKIDIVVNNAGITLKKPFFEFTSKEIDAIMGVNSRAVFISTIQAYKHMRRGVISSIVSLGGWISPIHYSVYAASKHAIEGFMKSAKKDVKKPINIMMFHPFRLDTNLNKKSLVKSPSKHRLSPKLYAQYVVAKIKGQRLKTMLYGLRNWLIWIKKLIF